MSMEFEFGERPEPGQPQEPSRAPEPTPWHDPGPPVRKVSLPPDLPGTGVPVENPETHTPEKHDQD